MYRPLPQKFFQAEALEAAQALVGQILVHKTPQGLTAGRIVETEAYTPTDPASHSFRGWTKRNGAMFLQGGIAYVYRCYGVHWCFNVVVGDAEHGAAVLIRALEPHAGVALMEKRRGTQAVRDLARGPGRLTQAMGITGAHDKVTLLQPPLYIAAGEISPPKLVATPRIGISQGKELLWRFYDSDSPFVSGPKRKAHA